MSVSRRKDYRVVAISLYAPEADGADHLVEILKSGGWPKANRSLIVREALSRLQEDLVGKDPDDVFRYFVDRQAKRAKSHRPQPVLPSGNAPT